jgi:hypothetical protein
MVTPTFMARPWIGDSATGTPARLLSRAMGGRDLALGLGALMALERSDQGAGSWVALGGMADGVDALSTVVAFGSLPRRSRWAILAVTVGAATVSLAVARSMAPPPDALAPSDPATGPSPFDRGQADGPG